VYYRATLVCKVPSHSPMANGHISCPEALAMAIFSTRAYLLVFGPTKRKTAQAVRQRCFAAGRESRRPERAVCYGFMRCHVFHLRFTSGNIQPAPGIQGVIDLKLPLYVFQVVRIAQAVAYRDGLEAGSQGIGIQTVRVCGIDDFSHA